MVPTNKIEELISKHSLLEKELSSGKTEKKQAFHITLNIITFQISTFVYTIIKHKT